jgi:hypothetical protein
MSEGRELLTFSRDRAKEANAIYYAIGNFDVEFKAVGYLLAANAAGLAGCVTLLKDYATVPQLKGIGVFICLFGLGFIFAVIGFVAITIIVKRGLEPLRRMRFPVCYYARRSR